jgi:DNA-binding CsgD family transcriptional regulator
VVIAAMGSGPSESAPLEFLAGRDADTAVLSDAVAELASGRGRSVLVEGEPGIGKSALAAAVLAGIDTTAVQVLRGGCAELGRRFPLSVMVTALGVAEDSADPDRAEAAALLAHRTPVGVGRQPSAPGGDGTTAAVEKLAELVDRLCSRQPVVVLVDDLQWADEPSLDLWTQLHRAAAQLPLLLIGLCRPTPRPAELEALRAELAAAEHGVLLRLEPLAPADVGRLAARLAGAEPGPAFARLLESAAGNPLYIRELVDALSRSGGLVVADGVAEPGSAEPVPVPGSPAGVSGPSDPSVASLAGVIADRLDFLSPPCRAVLQAAALHGTEVTAEDVAELAGIPAEQVAPLLREAVAGGVVEPVGPDAVRFRHGLIRQALYESLPEPLRAAMYRDAARHLIRSGARVERTAEAVLRALEVADGWELDWLAANAEPLAYRAPAIAVELFEHALGHATGGDPRAERLEDQLANVFFLTARYAETERLTRRILAGQAEPERRGWAAWLFGYSKVRTMRLDEALAVIAEVGPVTTEVWRARLTALRAMVHNRANEAAEMRAAAEEALALAEKLGDPVATGYALHCLALRCIQEGDQAASLAYMDRAVAVAEGQRPLDDLLMMVLSNRATVLGTLDRAQEAADSLRRATVLGERVGTSRISMLRALTCAHAFDRGDWDDALAELDTLPVLTEYADIPVLYHGFQALIAAHRDESEALARHLQEAEAYAEVSSPHCLAPAIMARGYAAEREGRTDDALAVLEVFLDPEQTTFHETRADWLPYVIRLAFAAGRDDAVRRAAEASRAEYELEPLPYKKALYDWCRGLAEGDPAPVLATADYFGRADRPFDRGAALEDAADLQAARGDLEAARAGLTEAVALYAGRDAAWDSQRAAARLRRHGVRLGVRGPRQRPRHGWAALTDTELRVAELVAAGMSNPDIAGRLLLSRRTVQTHVSHILGKLGARSRREIADHAQPALG